MSAINNQTKNTSNKNFALIIGSIVIVAFLLFAYLMWYVAPAEEMLLVKVIAITESGCIAETLNGFAVNIGDCHAQPGQYVNALIDQKAIERAALMNPTN